MNDLTVIVALAKLSFFLAAVSSSAYLAWVETRRMPAMPGPRFLPRPDEIQQITLLCLTQKSSSAADQLPGGGAGNAPAKPRLSAAGDWLAPIIVCVLVIMMTVAVVGFLLGDR
ncbi:MAG: hypothetical protein WCC04_14180 [Terriglobales bacterium]